MSRAGRGNVGRGQATGPWASCSCPAGSSDVFWRRIRESVTKPFQGSRATRVGCQPALVTARGVNNRAELPRGTPLLGLEKPKPG